MEERNGRLLDGQVKCNASPSRKAKLFESLKARLDDEGFAYRKQKDWFFRRVIWSFETSRQSGFQTSVV